MKTKVSEIKIDELISDDLNANKGTEFGGHLIERSFRELGAGRSILIDKNNRIIAGNKSTEAAALIGLNDVIVVETDGTKVVAVKRVDIDIDSKIGRDLAISDNATAKANITWDQDAITAIAEQWEVKPEEWGISTEFTPQPEKTPGEGPKSALLIVECDDPDRLNELFYELKDRGFMVQLKQPKDHD